MVILLTLNRMLIFFCRSTTSNDIHLSPKHNWSPCTETHLSLRVDSLPGENQDAPVYAKPTVIEIVPELLAF